MYVVVELWAKQKKAEDTLCLLLLLPPPSHYPKYTYTNQRLFSQDQQSYRTSLPL